MEPLKLFWLFAILIIGSVGEYMAVMGGHGSRRCSFPAVFNFGDSNSDTGGRSAAIGEITLPNGETFFGRAAGRACDGRLILDFISKSYPCFLSLYKYCKSFVLLLISFDSL